MTDQLEKRLQALAPQASDSFRHSLGERLLDEQASWTAADPFNWKRLVAAVVVIASLLAAIGLSPAGRALAEFFARIGPFDFTSGPTFADVSLTLEASDSPDQQPVTLDNPRFVTAAEASQAAGWTVLAPGTIPEGYTPANPRQPISLFMSKDAGAINADITYVADAYAEVLQIAQQHITPDWEDAPPIGTGAVQPVSVTVNGGDGLFMEGVNWGIQNDPQGTPQPAPYNVLTWEQTVDGEPFVFWIFSSERLSLEILLSIAESMQP